MRDDGAAVIAHVPGRARLARLMQDGGKRISAAAKRAGDPRADEVPLVLRRLNTGARLAVSRRLLTIGQELRETGQRVAVAGRPESRAGSKAKRSKEKGPKERSPKRVAAESATPEASPSDEQPSEAPGPAPSEPPGQAPTNRPSDLASIRLPNRLHLGLELGDPIATSVSADSDAP